MVKKKSGLIPGIAEQANKLVENSNKESNLEIQDTAGKMVLSVTADYNLTKDDEVNKFLEDKAREVLFVNAKSAVALGSIFQEVAEKLSGSNQYDGAYVKWLTMNNYNKATAHRHRVRYNLYSKATTDEGRGMIACLPQKHLAAINKHEDFESIIGIIDQGTTKCGLDELLFKKSLSQKKEKVIDASVIVEGFNNFFQDFKGFKVDDIEGEDAKDFSNDIKKIQKIMSKWI